jgi:sulfur-carrier protein
MKAVYFAWVRERIGKSEEQIAPPADVFNVGDLIAWLSKRGDGYAYAFEKAAIIRAAIDRAHVKHNAVHARLRFFRQ